jgi:guanylate kinase
MGHSFHKSLKAGGMVDSQHIFKGLFHPEPLVVVISGPSGVGKDAVLQILRKYTRKFHIVVTCTSRPPRANEKEGFDYFFISRQRFEEMIANDEFFEHSLVYKDYKGIPRVQIQQAFDSGKDVVIRVDVQGAEKLRSICPGAILIFLTPDNEEEWVKRLKGRASENAVDLKVRMDTARHEVEQLSLFDYVVVNSTGALEKTVETILDIINAEHHRVDHRKVTL